MFSSLHDKNVLWQLRSYYVNIDNVLAVLADLTTLLPRFYYAPPVPTTLTRFPIHCHLFRERSRNQVRCDGGINLIWQPSLMNIFQFYFKYFNKSKLFDNRESKMPDSIDVLNYHSDNILSKRPEISYVH